MKLVSFSINSCLNKLLLASAFFLLSNTCCSKLVAQSARWQVDSSIHLIDGLGALYSNVHPGDTVFLKSGSRDKLLIRNFTGSPGNPITFINKDGIVDISTNSYYGISILNCRYIRLSGQGDSNSFYGIQITKVLNGSGIGFGATSSDMELDHVSVEHCLHSGIVAKTDPDCSLQVTRNNFTQFNTNIHDNYIADVGNEGMYIGSSFYAGFTIHCNGNDTIVLPPVLNEVKIYNNVVKRSGWDGIQVSSAPLHCQIFNNRVYNDSQAATPNQMSGILIGGGSKCDCYNNLISDGKGDGIEDHGLGGNKIYNNIIVNAGQSFLPNDAGQMKHGIFVSDVSVTKDSSFNILFNDIINPKSDGIRFQSVKSKHNLIASNLIINPGNYNLYETGNTSFSGKDAYVMIPNTVSDLQLKNNYFTRSIAAAGISAIDYSPQPGSPLINKGYQQYGKVITDFHNNRRPVGGLFDIGAIEYNSGEDRLFDTAGQKQLLLFPNPVPSKLTIRYLAAGAARTIFQIYNLKGQMVLQQYKQFLLPGPQELQVNVAALSFGLYVYSINTGKEITYGKFIKL